MATLFRPGPPFFMPTASSSSPTTTTKKFNTFISTPLQDIALPDIPGVGPVAHARLVAAGVVSSEQLMGHFLLANRGEDEMRKWLVEEVGVRAQEAGKIVAALAQKGRVVVSV